MYYIIGPGNPGEQYQYTRHNVAWMIFDSLFPDRFEYHKYMHADVHQTANRMFIKPQTFMNASGEVLHFLKSQEDFSSEHLIVIHDDIDLAFGTIRISYDRGDGGHNGLKSINKVLGSKQYLRIRIGISLLDPETGILRKPNVLGNFSLDERSLIIKDISYRVKSILDSLVSLGREATMSLYNQK